MYVMDGDERRPRLLQAARRLRRCRATATEPRRYRLRRRPGRPVRRGCASASCSTTFRDDAIHVRSGLVAARAAQRHRAAGAVRRPGQGGDRAGLAARVHRLAPARSSSSSPAASASCSTPSRRRCAPRACCKQSQQLAGELQTQQKELQQTNEELAHKAQLLAEQNAEVERKNQEIELARRALEEKAAELALTSRYKSEFLANMSHELRTPLNSILILGQQLAENADEQPVSDRQVEFAKTIHGAGTDLLNLISDILDLSKIESGTVTVECEDLLFTHLRETIERNFRHEAEARKLAVHRPTSTRSSGRTITTDPKRLLQVLKNLLSNAFKFTEHGSVRLHVGVAHERLDAGPPGARARRRRWSSSRSPTPASAFRRRSSSIIFEAFQQADAGTSRKYGGTGLGLAISRELAHLLGGEMRLASVAGQRQHVHAVPAARLHGPGLPQQRRHRRRVRAAPRRRSSRSVLPVARVEEIADDRERIEPGRRVAADRRGRSALRDGAARTSRATAASRCSSPSAAPMRWRWRASTSPTAISLDIFLPDMLGWTVLDQLKQDPSTRHIPVQILTVEEERQHGLERGAFAFMNKPAHHRWTRSARSTASSDFAAPRAQRSCWSSRTTRPSR